MTRDKLKYRVVAFYDTETTNIHGIGEHRAYPVLFILNRTGAIDYSEYSESNDDIVFYRDERSFVDALDSMISHGIDNGYIPIVAAYNLMFDLQPILWSLKQRYDFEILAQSSTHVYTLDLVSDGNKVLRFWDMFFLEQNGLAAMGDIAGTAKLYGDWDYSLIRTPETVISDTEYGYARADVRVLPAYLKYLLEANEFLDSKDFGVSCMTKTGVVRLMGKRTIGKRRVKRDGGYSTTVYTEFLKLCERESPKSYEQYATRKACFYGGFTFTSARYACTMCEHVASFDVTSMHHLFINGRNIPVNFCKVPIRVLGKCANDVLNTTLETVLDRYDKPFASAFHGCFEFTGLRLKKGSIFERDGIALIPRSKFGSVTSTLDKYGNVDTTHDSLEYATRNAGYRNRALKCVFAYGKLYSAEKCTIWCNEIELWCISRVYEWDTLTAVSGEVSVNFVKPPDYVSLQSNKLFAMKNEMKRICNQYTDGEPYSGDVSDVIPIGIRDGLRDGSVSSDFLKAYYVSTVKGMFNGIYGTMAQDVLKPSYIADFDANIFVDADTVPRDTNFDAVKPETDKVLYTYGMRIVGGSRMHLVIAIELLGESGASILGGDTDSIKLTYGVDSSGYVRDTAFKVLEPLHNAATLALMRAQERVRTHYGDIASGFEDVGCFDMERCGASYLYRYHIEYWNKCRISIGTDGHAHVTCAGLSRPKGSYNVETMLDTMIREYGIGVVPHVFGYNTTVYPALSHNLEKHIPKPSDMFDDCVTDYMGKESHVISHESVALYDSAKVFGDMSKEINAENVTYSKKHYRTPIDEHEKVLTLENDEYIVYIDEKEVYRCHV